MQAMLKSTLFQGMAGTWLVVLAVVIGSGSVRAQTPAAAPGAITFTKDVAPIFQRSCQSCHRPDNIAPMSLLTYEQTRPWARSIKEKVALRIMPPWHIDPNVGIHKFKNDGGLSEAEIATIVQWVDAGAPQGNPADMPSPRQFDDNGWTMGEPDLIVQMLPQDLLVPGKGPDQWRNFVAESGLPEDRYIRAVEVKPIKGTRVIHHIGTSLVYPDGSGRQTIQAKNGNMFEDGAGMLMKAGTKVNFGLHIHPSPGQDIQTNLAMAFKFHPKGYVPKFIAMTELLGDDSELDLPPNTDNIRNDSYLILSKPTRLLTFAPHMHTRGKAMCLEVIYPEKSKKRDGSRVETISCVNNFNFYWMMAYEYASDVQPLLPAGAVLHFISWHNNTSLNKLNPDPDNWIGYGQRSIDDMGVAWVTYYNLSEDDFQRAVAERKATSTTQTQTSQTQTSQDTLSVRR
jgi:hypothetical protein